MASDRMTYACGCCGSENTRADAWAAWNEKAQAWELENVTDDLWCMDCGSTAVEEIEAPD